MPEVAAGTGTLLRAALLADGGVLGAVVEDDEDRAGAGAALGERVVEDVAGPGGLDDGEQVLGVAGDGGAAGGAAYLLGDAAGGTGRELVFENVGYGTICLLFDDNNSQNTVSPGQFNFDFLNTGGGGFDLFDFNANDNTGTVGSSDGSVVIP